jgi:hypothetical protein
MRMSFFAIAFTSFLLFGCAAEYSLDTEHDVFRGDFQIRENNRDHLLTLLRETNLEELSNFEEPVNSLSSQTECEGMYEKYNEKHHTAKLSNEMCSWNLTNGKYDISSPISYFAVQLDAHHLYLEVAEEGLGGTILFAYVYDTETQKVSTPDVIGSTNITGLYFDDGKLIYTSGFETPEPIVEYVYKI